MKKLIMFLIVSLSLPSSVAAFTIGWQSTIHIHNTTPHQLYGATYYVDGDAHRFGTPFVLPAHSVAPVTCPGGKIGYYRHLFVTPHEQSLLGQLKASDVAQLHHINVGAFCGTSFFVIGDSQGSFSLVDEHDHDEHLMVQVSLQQGNVQHGTVRVKTGEEYWQQEMKYVGQRKKSISQDTIMNSHVLPEIPDQVRDDTTIALCCSGGGFRAMLATAGFLAGAEATGLLDQVTYIASLSGSTWANISWITNRSSAEQSCQDLCTRLDNGIVQFTKAAFTAYTEQKRRYTYYGGSIGPVDIYGIFLAQTLLADAARVAPHPHPTHWWHYLTLSDLEKMVDPATMPYQLFAAVTPTHDNGFGWLEFAPGEVKSDHLGASIPTWALGRTFHNGVAPTFSPEPSLGYIMGILGSSFCVSVNGILRHAAIYMSPLFPDLREMISIDAAWANTHASPARLPNFAYHLDKTPDKQERELVAVDGGYACSYPLKTLMHPKRAVDVIIILDWLREPHLQAATLKRVTDDVTIAYDTLPPIDYDQVNNQKIAVFKPQKPNSPFLIYLPLRADADYDPTFDPETAPFCSTYNFSYSPEQAQTLAGLTRFVAHKYRDVIQAVIEEAKLRKKNRFG